MAPDEAAGVEDRRPPKRLGLFLAEKIWSTAPPVNPSPKPPTNHRRPRCVPRSRITTILRCTAVPYLFPDRDTRCGRPHHGKSAGRNLSPPPASELPPTPEIAGPGSFFATTCLFQRRPRSVARPARQQRLNKTDHADLRTLADDDILDAISACPVEGQPRPRRHRPPRQPSRAPREELVENQYRIGLVRMNAPSRTDEHSEVTLARPDQSEARGRRGSRNSSAPQLSQFMDQIQLPLGSHAQRRLSALGWSTLVVLNARQF